LLRRRADAAKMFRIFLLAKSPDFATLQIVMTRTTGSYSSLHPAMVPRNRRHIFYQGRVQGVGFRYTVRNIAMRHNVTGYVRNMPDGRVELIVEGPDEEMDQFLDSIKQRMNEHIRGIEQKLWPATGEFPQFQIRH
jgi:acylphosphatase